MAGRTTRRQARLKLLALGWSLYRVGTRAQTATNLPIIWQGSGEIHAVTIAVDCVASP